MLVNKWRVKGSSSVGCRRRPHRACDVCFARKVGEALFLPNIICGVNISVRINVIQWKQNATGALIRIFLVHFLEKRRDHAKRLQAPQIMTSGHSVGCLSHNLILITDLICSAGSSSAKIVTVRNGFSSLAATSSHQIGDLLRLSLWSNCQYWRAYFTLSRNTSIGNTQVQAR
jgi:hypothetical protein